MRGLLIHAALLMPLAVAGAGEVRLSRPEGLCFDDQGRLYVADTGHHRVLVFSPQLELLRAIGSEGREPGRFARPADVAVDSQGRLVVADSGNHRVQVLAPDGSPVATVGGPEPGEADGQFRQPTRVAVDENDHILVADTRNHRLQVFDRQGRHLFTLANRTGAVPLERLKAGKDGERRPRDWERTDPGQFNEPGGIFYDRELGRLFVANGWNCRCEVLDYDSTTGRISRRPEATGIVWGWWVTRGIAGDARGRLLGCNTGFGNVLVFEDRASLTNQSKSSRTIDGGPYGKMRELMDIAIAPNGDIALADAGNDRVLLFPPDARLPASPRVESLSRTQAVVTWETLEPAVSEAVLRQGAHPERTPGHERPWDTAETRTVTARGGPSTRHRLTLGPLEPGARTYYRLRVPSLRSIPGGGYSREYAVATLPPKGQTSFVRIPVKCLLLTNVVNLDTAEPGAPPPPPMPPREIDLYREAFRETQLFYWCNSRMRYWLDLHLYVDETMYRAGKDRADCPELMALPRADHGGSLRRLVEAAGRSAEVYVGQVVCEARRDWNDAARRWRYAGSGGGTYGVKWPTPGRSQFLGGSDVAWLLCHEYKHQLESQYTNSGLDKEDDRSIFCHFAPQHPGWKWPTAYDHGEHWDGIAWQLRHFTDAQYFRNLYGEVLSAEDADGDGIPDDDPRLPLDEQRFASRPDRADTDGDGLDDMGEVLASRWVTALNAPLRKRLPGKWPRPDPTNPDSDGDGVPDGDDPYPLYPFQPRVPRGTAQVDGTLAEWGEEPHYWLDHARVKLRGWTRWDRDYLYYAFAIEGPWRKLTLVVDQDADGFYVGGDNVYAEFVPAEGGARKANVRMHYCNLGRWPWFDNEHRFVKPEVFPFASGRSGGRAVLEFACPRNEMCGLSLRAGEEVGMALYIGIPEKGAISLFEPWSLFDAVLTGP
ncbi:MAG: hypothetical protein ACLF0G_16060 [Candidatus Brocadiia bacterium]